METRFTILLIEFGVAIIIQIGIMIGILMAVRRSAKRMESLAAQLEQRGFPLLETAKGMVENSRPKIENIIENASSSSSVVRKQIERLDVTMSDAMDRTRLQVIRADELTSKAMDKVEEATGAVARAIAVPARQVSGVFQGISTGVAVFFGRRDRQRNMQRDEMFI